MIFNYALNEINDAGCYPYCKYRWIVKRRAYGEGTEADTYL